MGGWSRLLRFFKAALQFNGFSKTVLLNIVLAALCENGQGATATYYIQVGQSVSRQSIEADITVTKETGRAEWDAPV